MNSNNGRVLGLRAQPVALFVIALGVFASLSAGSRVLYNQAENRLLQQRTNEAGAVLQVSVSQIRTPLDAAARLAVLTDGDAAAFASALTPYVGTGKSFTAAALFRVGKPVPLAQVGAPLSLDDDPHDSEAMLASATASPFAVIDQLSVRRLGYAIADTAKKPTFVVYGERLLGADPTVRRRTDEPFAQLNYAIYLGNDQHPEHLLGASVSALPLGGRHASASVPFGNSQLLLVMSPIGHLSGDLFADLWWIVAVAGVIAAVTVGVLVNRLLERRDTAMALADDNERLYDEQRHIAETLQLSLLPQQLAQPPGTSVAARYWPAGAANLIGGDFYDLFAVDDGRWALTIGDVCGKGIEAAALTGLARHTIRASARSATEPSDVLHSVHVALRDHEPATFCTACFAFLTVIDSGEIRVTLTLGGHPAPLLRRADGTVTEVGLPGTLLGMIEPTLHDTVVDLHDGDLIVLYTDGLTDAPGDQAVPMDEIVDTLRRLGDRPIEQLADDIRALKRKRRPGGSADDTALVIVRVGEPAAVADAPYASAAMVSSP